MHMRIGMWDISSLYALKTVVSTLVKCNLDLVAVQEVRWVEGRS
jgi:hypothetical protein